MQSCDILIIGAGPVGVTLALELALHNVSLRIIDKAPERSDKSRALVVHPRTLELLNRHRSPEALSSRGQTLHGVAIYINQKLVTPLNLNDLGTTDTQFPLPLLVSQAKTETFLDERLAEYGVHVERPVTAMAIEQDNTGVTTTLRLSDGSHQTVRSKYVVGCDGAHSVVRHAANNLTFEGAPYPQDFILCDARLHDSSLPKNRICLFLGSAAVSRGMVMMIPIDGELVRVVASEPLSAPENDPTVDQFTECLHSHGPVGSGTLTDAVWLTRFRFHSRIVSNYRDGRLFLAGDAAHIHSPAGGQGMNAGIQDSVNLGWKLALALQGKTADAEVLLDSYNAERRPIGKRLISGTDSIFSSITTSSTWFIMLRNFVLRWILPWFLSSTRRRGMVLRFLSGFGIKYRRSPVVGTTAGFKGPIRGGDRLPDGVVLEKSGADLKKTHLQRLCGGKPHHLLLFAGISTAYASTSSVLERAEDQISSLMRSEMKTHTIYAVDLPRDADSLSSPSLYVDMKGHVHSQFGFTEPGYVLVRPDGYVAHIGHLSKLDSLLEFLA
ncbi:FAD binding domain-containing protein [Lasiosphaeria ovina]|uniref:FAD binding domain-containing protein n=1 Tax=Lasiosphaeria ovina TaxID=92902 RepID=A0AAE0JYP6_9PEZI|nr:FAD binding domain-containing protein [Lasiosphaeria ovina]